ncbi:BBSome-interacting protein 1-like [Hydractinia symbiolongicarpus]|uniref:BBSome-interacting protein 1-like n=1 Tax=Hydractinia symbiolongicarpus TaxID=13093 RepID=UPI00254FBC77|nr:BBSome-interacting protein 1-like [Hydractinia symbiolongicarpus]
MAVNESGSQDFIREVLPKTGLVYTEQTPMPVLCKPKILPLKSVTLEKLDKMQKEAQETIKKQEEESKLQERFLEQQREILGNETHSEPESLVL